MSIDTEIKGDPASITSTASWLSGSLRSGVTSAGASAAAVTRIPSWSGMTAAAVSGWASTADGAADEVAAAAARVASTLDTFATALRTAQREMKRIRTEAAAADLDVAGFVIHDPGPGPGKPSPLPKGAGGLKVSAHSLGQHAAAQAAFEEHQAKVEAYRKAETEAEAARSRIEGAAAALSSGGMDVLGNAMKVAGAGVTGFDRYTSDTTRARLDANRADYQHHRDLRDQGNRFAQKYMDRADARGLDILDKADRIDRYLGPAGHLLDAAGLAKDIKEGKPAEEIVGAKVGSIGLGIAGGVLGGLTGNPAIAAAGAAGGGALGEWGGEKLAGPAVAVAGKVWDHPMLAGPVAGPALTVGKLGLDHVDDVADVASKAPGAVADVASKAPGAVADVVEDVPVVGGGLKKLGIL